MIDGIVSGKLTMPPKELFNRRGLPYVIAKLQSYTYTKRQAVYVNVITFDTAVCRYLLDKAAGDMVSLGGIITPKLVNVYGQTEIELDITAKAVLGGYYVQQADGKGNLFTELIPSARLVI